MTEAKEIKWCDDCEHLTPKEKDQTHEPHICKAYNMRMRHGYDHPRIARPLDCKKYKKTS